MASADSAVATLAEALRRSIAADAVPAGVADLGRSLFPQAAALRLSLLTGDSGVLASVGSFLSPCTRLALALHPVSASAAGASVLRQAPTYLTTDTRRGLACYDFEGGAVFCLPINQPAIPTAGGTRATAVSPSPSQQQPMGALLLSFQPPAQLDAAHTRNLLLLSQAVAPGLRQAAVLLLHQCNLILGCDTQQQWQLLQAAQRQGQGTAAAVEAEGEEAGELESQASSSSEAGLWFDSEEEEEEEMLAAAGAGVGQQAGGSEQARQQEREGEGEGREQPQWIAGACRGAKRQPPDDPGAPAAALVVPQGAGRERREGEAGSEGQAQGSHAAVQAEIAGGWQAQARRQSMETGGSRAALGAASSRVAAEPLLPESPTAAKARAKAQASSSAGAAASGYGIAAEGGGGSIVEGSGEADKPPVLLKASPTEAATASSGSGTGEMVALGISRLRLLRFNDPALERRFVRWHYQQLWRADLLSVGLTLAWLLTVLSTGNGRMAGLLVLHVAAVLAPLALLQAPPAAYLCCREAALALLYLVLAAWQWSTFQAVGSIGGEGNSLMASGHVITVLFFATLPMGFQGRFCVQGPLQILLLLPLLHHFHATATMRTSAATWLEAAGVAGVAPLILRSKLELAARRAFMARLPLLQQQEPAPVA